MPLGCKRNLTRKHTAEHSKTACLGIYWPLCDVYIAHTTIKPEVSISLTEMPFLILQVNFHTSNDFCDWRLLKWQPIFDDDDKDYMYKNFSPHSYKDFVYSREVAQIEKKEKRTYISFSNNNLFQR